MIQPRIRSEVARVASHYRGQWLVRALTTIWTAAAVCGALLLVSGWSWGWDAAWTAPILAAVTLVGTVTTLLLASRVAREPRWVARRIEERYPELDSRLLAALEQRPDFPGGRFGFLQRTLLSEVLGHARRHPWPRAVPQRGLLRSKVTSTVALFALALVLLGLLAGEQRLGGGASLGGPADTGRAREASTALEPLPFEVEVEPGDVEVERGSSLIILARFGERLPPEVSLVVKSASGGERRTDMPKSLDDPIFAVRLDSVSEDLSYRVDFAEQSSDLYRVTVFDYPDLVRADARLEYPAYTNLEARTVVDTLRVSAVEGTELTWLCHLNKPVARGELIDEDENATPLESGGEENLYSATIRLIRSHRYRVQLVDDRGRENRHSRELTVRVLPNRPPDLKIVAPRRDVRVSPLEELGVEAKAWDDFGLLRSGLSYAMAGQESREVVLSQGGGGEKGGEVRHVIEFEALEAEPDQLLSYHFWAEDVGPDGDPRRVFSDMYFAEVRPFEEIFRQGEQPPGGAQQQQPSPQEGQGQQEGGSSARQAEELAELQKQIINGTWRLIRREAGARSSAGESDESLADASGGDDFQRDANLLRESQQSALEQARGLAEGLEDAESLQHVEAVKRHMDEALEQLTASAESASAEPLRVALSSEQSAYQSLLRLQAREHEVVRGQQQQQSSSSGQSSTRNSSSRSQRQLEQLQLSNSRNRYEMQRTAPSQASESPAQREDRQVLNRLRELARRQADLNERLKELESALAEAQDAQERQELERQLKRLRDEEQQILRDADELEQRMAEPQNQERMAEARDELRESREDVRRASEALREGRVSRAVAEGTRAERELRELRDDFRRRTGDQFAEEMEQMREDAERLDRRQEDLSSRLSDLNEPQSRSLRGTGEREEIEQGLREQREELDGLLERMQETVEKAEQPEPLLAEKLYDTVRQTRHTRTDETLDAARELLDRGFIDQASRVEREAREGIRELREGVEEAADSVLGDEAEALRRAQEEIERLAEDVEGEIARAAGEDPARRQAPGEGERPADRAGRESAGEEASSQERSPGDSSPREVERSAGYQEPREGEPSREGGRQGRDAQRQDGEPREESPSSERSGGGDRPPSGERSGESPEGQRPGEARSSSASPSTPRSPGEASAAEQPSGNQRGERDPNGRSGDRPSGSERPRGEADPNGRGGWGPWLDGEAEQTRELSPIAGDDFREWSDRLRDVEEMIEDPEMRAEAARIRDRARGFRIDLQRHSKEPSWDLVREMVVGPLHELHRQVSEELLRRQAREVPVPIDREPVPPEYSERVRDYYERLGSGE